MFIAHMPIGYLSTKIILRVSRQKRLVKTAFAAGVFGSVFPDLDLLWFYFVDNRAHHHHDYMTHKPLIYVALSLVLFGVYRAKKSAWAVVGLCFSINAVLHCAADTIQGRIHWLWPFKNGGTTLVQVQATHGFWVYSFLNHWTFKIEIIICILMVFIFFGSKSRAA